MNSAQKAAAEAASGPLLIVAGAGTGKTKTLTSRIMHLIATGTPPDRICAITFTNKAAKEMLTRVNRMRAAAGRKDFDLRTSGSARTNRGHNEGPGRAEPLISTFHSLGARILRKECRHLGRTPNFAIFDDHDSFDLVKKAVKSVLPKPPKNGDDDFGAGGRRMNAKAKVDKKETPAFFAQKISEIKNRDGALEEFRAEKNVVAVFEKYEEALLRNNAFDFDDLIEKVVALFKKHPDVLKKYQTLFDAIMVDEYQDINPKQCELITLLAEGHRNLSVVGDDEQTIYSWRYANIKTFLNFDKDWKGASVHFLEENYRSTRNIIDAAASVVKNNSFRTPKNLFTNNPAGDRITLFEAWGENEEAEWIAQEIAKRRVRGEVATDEDIAILYRTNAQSRAIEQALIRRDIPYKIFGGLKFYERREVKDAIAALRFASNHKDEVARERLEKNLTKRKFAAFQMQLQKLHAEELGTLASQKIDTAQAVSAAPQNADTAAGDAPNIPPLEMMKLFIDTFNYMDYLESNFLNADEREENIAELVAFAAEFQTLPDFLEKLSLLQATDDVNENEKRGKEVSLMTIHLAKGLEFDTVFIAGAAEGFLPHGRSLSDDASLEEERRLMYVAMTRARKHLAISFFGIPSRFIAEILPECISFAGGSAGVSDADNDKVDDNKKSDGEYFDDDNDDRKTNSWDTNGENNNVIRY